MWAATRLGLGPDSGPSSSIKSASVIWERQQPQSGIPRHYKWVDEDFLSLLDDKTLHFMGKEALGIHSTLLADEQEVVIHARGSVLTSLRIQFHDLSVEPFEALCR